MVRLIASDIDGTLIPYGAAALDPALFGLIRRLRDRSVLFCPASGRQYHSLRGLFAPVADAVCFLCENGAILYGPGPEETAPVLSRTPMPREPALALARAIQTLEGCRVLLSGANTSYICDSDEGYIAYLREGKGNRVTRIADPGEIDEAILKVSAYCPQGTHGPQRVLGPVWGAPFHMAAAGPDWVDFGLADKGKGLRELCAGLGIHPEEVVAFGDNWNDAAMLETAGTAWLMEGADPALAARFPRRCTSVAAVLEALLVSAT